MISSFRLLARLLGAHPAFGITHRIGSAEEGKSARISS
jgi:hypothetical protein